MLFEVEQGDDLADLRAAAEAEGPAGDMAREILSECPTLSPYEQSFWSAYGDLSSMRSIGMSAGPIPWDKIVDYARYYDFSRTDTDILLRVIRTMDSVWLNAVRRAEPPSQ